MCAGTLRPELWAGSPLALTAGLRRGHFLAGSVGVIVQWKRRWLQLSAHRLSVVPLGVPDLLTSWGVGCLGRTPSDPPFPRQTRAPPSNR